MGFRAVCVIRTDVARWRGEGYELNMEGLARRYDFEIAETLRFPDWHPLRILQLGAAMDEHEAEVIIVPSLAHIGGKVVAAELTRRWSIYAVGRSRTYLKGRRWYWPPV